MELTGKRIAILAANDYEDLELWYPLLRMREEGAEVKVVGVKNGPETCLSKHGYGVKIDLSADQVKAKDFDAVIIPGGWAPDRLRQCEHTVGLVREMFQQGKVVAAICHGAWVPASAGILKGRTATCVRAVKDDVINAGGKYVDREVVRDGNLITSRFPDDLPAFCREIIGAMAG
jgi:protease I